MQELKINNKPEYADHYEFMVARQIDGELWFYGAYRNGFKADQIASEIGGVVIHNVRIQGYRP